jgi:hypothetical protein
MIQINNNDQNLAAQLMSAAPEALRKFIADEMVIHDLLRFGQFSRKINCNNNLYGWETAGEIKRIFSKLQSAWKSSIKIRFSEEVGRIEVSIDAA